MLDSAIRALAASTNPPRVAAAFFESIVQIWDLSSQEKIAEFPTIFSFGAANLGLSSSGDLLVAGLSTANGKVAAYEVPSGTKLWERKVFYPNRLRFHPSERSVLCSSNRKSVLRLDVHTGDILEVIEKTSDYIEGRYGASLSVPANKTEPFRLLARRRAFDIKRASFGLLAVQFSEQFVCISEAGGPVRCFSCNDGSLQWTFDPGAHKHVLSLHYSPSANAFWGILRDLSSKGPRILVRFEPIGGTHEPVCDLASWEERFLKSDQLVTSRGEVRNLSNGALVATLAFPTREYPDD